MKLVELSPRENYGLFLRYEDGTEGVVDLSSLAGRGVFALWLKPRLFEQVKLSDTGVPEWPGELGLCSDSLYVQLTVKSAEELSPTCEGFHKSLKHKMVGAVGFEPTTSWSQTRRSTKLSYAPNLLSMRVLS